MKKNIKDILVIFCIVFIIIVGCIICIKIFNTKLLKDNEIKDELKGKTAIINDKEMNITEDGLTDLNSFVVDSFQKYGFTTMDNEKISPVVISKINNVQLDDSSMYNGKNFMFSMTLCNGVFFQSCNIHGQLYYHDETLFIKDIKASGDDKIYKGSTTDDERIKKVVLDEILSGGVFCLENSGRHIEKYVKADEYSVKDFSIKNYIVRTDKSIRAEVEGKIYLEKYEDEYTFDGIVSIVANMLSGNTRNAKKINVYEVPFNVEEEEIDKE